MKNRIFAYVGVLLLFLALAFPVRSYSVVPAEDLHGSCVYPVQEWHNPEYVKYCVPEVAATISVLVEEDVHSTFFRYYFSSFEPEVLAVVVVKKNHNNDGNNSGHNSSPDLPNNDTDTSAEDDSTEGNAGKVCKSGGDNVNRAGHHNCSGHNPSENSGQKNHKNN